MKKLLLIALSAFVLSCSSDSDSNNNNDDNPTGVAFIRGKMDGTNFDYTVNNTASDTYIVNANTGYSGEGLDRWYYYGGSITHFNPPTFAPVFYISWNNMYFGAGGDESGETAAFYDTVTNLPSNFLTDAQDQAHTPGLEIAFEAEDGTFYSTKSGSQTGSTLTINGSSEEVNSISGLKNKTIWGTFTAKLYNTDDAAEVIQVSNGSFKLILSELQ